MQSHQAPLETVRVIKTLLVERRHSRSYDPTTLNTLFPLRLGRFPCQNFHSLSLDLMFLAWER